MVTLKFYSKDDILFPTPETVLIPGAPHRFVGRYFEPADPSDPNSTGRYPAKELPDEFDSESKIGRRIKKVMTREAPLFPANLETAKECGVPFTKLTYRMGAWIADIDKS